MDQGNRDNKKKMKELQQQIMQAYHQYQKGYISKKEYCLRVKPLDDEVAKIEMATLQGTPAS